MKKIIISILIISTLLFSGCSKNTPETSKNEVVIQNPTMIDKEETSTPAPETQRPTEETQKPKEKKPKTKEVLETSIDDIEKYMLENNAVSGKRTQMAAEIIGAINGFKYSDSNVEIYEYDTNSKRYKDLVKNQKVSLDGMEGYEVDVISVNGKFVLLGEPSKSAIKIFDAFK